MKWFSWILNFIFPPKCPFCGSIVEDVAEICGDCVLPWTSSSREESFTLGEDLLCFAPFWYQTTAKEGILRLKFSGAKHYAPCFAQMMASCLSGVENFHLVTWVPLSKKRQKWRGYNQSELLAKEVAKAIGSTAKPCLRKVKENQAQSSLKSARQRRENIKGVYDMGKTEVTGQRILLIDDVITTGATLSACQQVLKQAGAGEVVCLGFARGRK